MKSIKECATIHIANLQTSDGAKSKTEFCENCDFYEKDGTFYVAYKEPADADMGKTGVVLKINKGIVSLRRMGEFKSKMLFEAGKDTEALYQTPFGRMDIKIRTKNIENDISKNGGKLKIEYTIIIDGEEIENDLNLEIQKENVL